MPSFVIAHGPGRTGQTFDAVICDPSAATGHPDRRSAVPVKIRLVNDRTFAVDGENREIISTTGMNGTTTYLVDGSTARLRNRERRRELARASSLLDQLRDHLMRFKEEGEPPEFIAEGLGLLYLWTSQERERLAAAPRCTSEESNNE
jgi:hypothetical protein